MRCCSAGLQQLGKRLRACVQQRSCALTCITTLKLAHRPRPCFQLYKGGEKKLCCTRDNVMPLLRTLQVYTNDLDPDSPFLLAGAVTVSCAQMRNAAVACGFYA